MAFHNTTDSMTACDDAFLLHRAGQDDQLAWRRLIDKHDALLHSVARSFRLQPADACDVAQTTWLRLVQKMHTIQDPEKLRGWLAVTATRECLAILRKRSLLDLEPALDDAPDPAVDLATMVAESETAAALWADVGDLPRRQRLLLQALFREDCGSYSDVAAKCSMPIGSIGPTRARALSRLRQKLAGKGIGREEL
jgi:RNA polymerase sigma factor (sigma-70 family)